MNPTNTTSSDTGRFACLAAAWAAHEGELLGYLRHQTIKALRATWNSQARGLCVAIVALIFACRW